MGTICSQWFNTWVPCSHTDFINVHNRLTLTSYMDTVYSHWLHTWDCMFTRTSYVGSICSHWLHTLVLYAHADFIHGYCMLRWVYTWVLFAHIDLIHGYHMLTMTLHVGSVFSHWLYYVGTVACSDFICGTLCSHWLYTWVLYANIDSDFGL